MASFQGTQALIIEDDQTSINVLRKLLDQLLVTSIVIDDSYNIEEHLLNVQRPDVVFLDLILSISQDTPRYEAVKELIASVYVTERTIYLWEGLCTDEMVKLFGRIEAVNAVLALSGKQYDTFIEILTI